MTATAPVDINELVGDLIGPAVSEPDYVNSSRVAIDLLSATWCAWSGRDLPTVGDADETFRAALADEGDLDPAQVSRLASELCPSPTDGLGMWLADAAERLVLRIRPWIPVWVGYTWWALEWCRYAERDQIVFLGRDGLPFYAAARYLPGRIQCPALLDAPRRLLGSPLLDEHLATTIDCHRPVAFVDTGCYGTVATSLARYCARHGAGDAAMLFLASRNPRIFGYLNYVMSWQLLFAGPCSAPGPMDFAIYACDLAEALPKPYTVHIGPESVQRVPADLASFVLSLKVCVEVARYARRCPGNPAAEASMASEQLYQVFRSHPNALLLDSCAPKCQPRAQTLTELGINGLPPQNEIFGLSTG
jgi:hypothetical protein